MVQDLDKLQQRIAALPPEKRALFEQQLMQRNLQMLTPTSAQASSISRCQSATDYPLSLAQQHLWFLHQLEPENPAYNIAMLWRFNQALDITILERSLEAIGQRHATLRTRFAIVADQPVQIVQPTFSLQLPKIDLRAIASLDSAASLVALETRTQQIAHQIAQIPFDLAQSLPWRVTLLQTNSHNSHYSLVIVLHHSIADGWSRGILLKEFATLYKAFQSGQASPLPELAIQYTDFAVWQQTQHSKFASQIAYWRKQLADLPALELQVISQSHQTALTDHHAASPTQNMSSFRSGTRSHLLPISLLNQLKTLSRRSGVTLFTTLLTAFKVLLHRYTQQTDIAIGVPTANRHSSETQELIGFFVNTLVLRTDLSHNPSFQTLLEQVRRVVATAHQHQDVPFAKLVEALQPQRSLEQTPFFQIMFQVQNEAYQLQNSLNPALEIPGLELQQEWIETGFTKFDLTWHLIERTEGILAVVEYRLNRYRATAIDRMLAHFQVLLEAIVADPTQPISQLSILSPLEKQQLEIWSDRNTADCHAFTVEDDEVASNDSFDRQLGSIPVHYQYEAQVERTPHHIAVSYQDQQLTYTELNTKANQLAHYLRSLQVNPETPIGVCLERSPDLLVALLGVLKAGAAYVPLDPQLPRDRANFIVQDAQLKILITDTIRSSDSDDIVWLNLKADWQLVAPFPCHNPLPITTLNHLAYIIYTSGSTGQPKGTLITHQSLIHYLTWCVQSYVVRGAIGVPVQSSIGFDATITSLYTPLLVGQSVILLPDAIESLAQLLVSDQHYSFIKLTPAHLRLLSQWLALRSPSQVLPQTFILGGEALTESDLTFWRRIAPGSRFINEYGPTEATVGCCVYQVTAPLTAVPASNAHTTLTTLNTTAIPIGRPISNTQLYILDSYLQPVPVGVPGELYIGGTGLAQGYLNQPELTAAKFIQIGTNRLYRTGDRACYLEDGNIIFLGRCDQQVKIRGYRVELEEISAVLKQHRAIQDAVVAALSDHNQQTRLVAYFVPNSSSHADTQIDTTQLDTTQLDTTQLDTTQLDTRQLRQFLQSKLPDYMLPSRFVELTALPLTPNGKVDRQSLPQPSWIIDDSPSVTSYTSIESHLVRIWSEVLGVAVTTQNNFFELGGDSILSLQIVARANQIGLKITPRQLFQYQTIAELATVVTTSSIAEQGLVSGTVPLTPIQHWLLAQNLPELHHFNQAILLEVESGLEPKNLFQALRTLWLHHDALRLRFVSGTKTWQQFHAEPDAAIAWSVVNLLQLSSAAQGVAIETTAAALQASLDLTQRLWCAVLFQCGQAQTDRLLLISHHLIIDAVSWQILLEDLVTAYQALQQQQLPQLPLKTTAFQSWAECLTTNATSELWNHEVSYWAKQVGSPLPRDYSTSAVIHTVATVDRVNVSLEAELTQALLTQFAKSRQSNLIAVLLTAVFCAFQQWTRSNALLIDLEGHGRDTPFSEIDVSRTVGWFTCIFPVLLQSTSYDVSEILSQVRSNLQSIPNQGLGYGVLRYLRAENSLRDLPQAEIKFNYLGSLDRISRSFILGLAQESIGEPVSPLAHRRYLVDINCWLQDNQLCWSWSYSRTLYQRSTIEQLAQTCLVTLQSLSSSRNVTGYAPSDFPAARLNQQQLEQFMRQIQQPGRK